LIERRLDAKVLLSLMRAGAPLGYHFLEAAAWFKKIKFKLSGIFGRSAEDHLKDWPTRTILGRFEASKHVPILDWQHLLPNGCTHS
jgi:hypothetical protein